MAELNFTAVIDHSPVRTFLVDSQRRLLHLNDKARQMFAGVDGLVNRDFLEVLRLLWSPAIAEEFIGHFHNTLTTGQPCFESGFSKVRTDREGGQYFDSEIHRITLPDGQSGVACYFIDISEHVLARQALQKSENRKSAILSASLDAIITMDHAGKIVDFNPSAEKIFGFSRELILGCSLAETIIPERFRARHREGLARYLADGVGPVLGKRLEMPALHAEGHEFPVELSISRIADTSPPLFTATLRDITEKKGAEDALKERNRLFALRLEISNALAGNDYLPTVLQACAQALVLHLDAAFARFWTVNESEDVLELRASAGLYTHLDGQHRRVKMGEFKIGRIARNRKALLTNDVLNDPNISSPEWARREGMVAFAGYPLVLEGRVLGVMAMFAKHPFSDNVLSELAPIGDGLAQWMRRKRAESALHQAQVELKQHAKTLETTVAERTAELREKIGELEAFSYSVSHDMRSPLRAMQGYATALLKSHREKLDSAGQHYLERISKAAKRMDLLIQEVLTYSTVAKAEITLEPIDLEKLVAEIIQTYPDFQAARASITVISPLEPVLGHEAFLTQVISNLLGNALKFRKQGAIPTITARTELQEPFVRVWFEDDGIGIDPSHFGRIFDIFGRVYSEKLYEGTGIGLAIAKKAVERMGGRIGVVSELGNGSRFWFTLKMARQI